MSTANNTRYFVIDAIDGAILTSTRDYRVAQTVSQGILDSHVDYLPDISNNRNAVKWAAENWEKFESQSVKFAGADAFEIVEPSKLSTRFSRDKPIARERRKYFTFLYLLADNILYSYLNDNLVSLEVLAALQETLRNDALLDEYAAIVNLNREEARKEIELKVSNRNYALVRIQARVENLVDIVNKETDINKIKDLYEVTRAQLIGVTV
jgi:hypothetical protein